MTYGDLPPNVRTLFLSDLHLGFRLSRGAHCQELLENIEAEQILLVGDTVDLTRLSRRWHWPTSHQAVLDLLIQRNPGTAVSLLPGNHDPVDRDPQWVNRVSGRFREQVLTITELLLQLPVSETVTHQTQSGRRLLVTHGDLFDQVDDKLGGVPKLGSRLFDRISVWFPDGLTHGLRALFKLILARPDQIQAAVVNHARQLDFDGVVFGHLHRPSLAIEDGFVIANTGDWVEHRSGLIETTDGRLQLFDSGKIVQEL